jgi:desulfoferrodoxin (superoxide reductase-like protein)
MNQNNRGKWADLPTEHVPTVNVIKGKKNISITVLPPFSGTPGHYIESIILTDYALKEIQKSTFPRGSTATNTIFNLPWNSKGEFYVILKCNQHDMWYHKIVIH